MVWESLSFSSFENIILHFIVTSKILPMLLGHLCAQCTVLPKYMGENNLIESYQIFCIGDIHCIPVYE